MSFIFLLNTKEDVLKNFGNQKVIKLTFILEVKNTTEVSGDQQWFGFQHSSKYPPLCSLQE